MTSDDFHGGINTLKAVGLQAFRDYFHGKTVPLAVDCDKDIPGGTCVLRSGRTMELGGLLDMPPPPASLMHLPPLDAERVRLAFSFKSTAPFSLSEETMGVVCPAVAEERRAAGVAASGGAAAAAAELDTGAHATGGERKEKKSKKEKKDKKERKEKRRRLNDGDAGPTASQGTGLSGGASEWGTAISSGAAATTSSGGKYTSDASK